MFFLKVYPSQTKVWEGRTESSRSRGWFDLPKPRVTCPLSSCKIVTKDSRTKMLERRKLFQQEICAPQTKILEAWTKRRMCVFEVLSTDVSTRFGRRVIESSFKNAHATLCSIFQNLRLGSIIIYFHHFLRTKNCAISHPRLNEGTCIREYSKIRPSST